MASAGAKGVPRVRHVALKPHRDWAHGHSTPTGRVSPMPAFVAPARQLRCILERDLAPITGFGGEHAYVVDGSPSPTGIQHGTPVLDDPHGRLGRRAIAWRLVGRRLFHCG